MKRRRVTASAGAAAFLLTVVILFAVFFLRTDDNTPAVHLPPASTQTGNANDESPNIDAADLPEAEVRPDTVQAVIASLARPEHYRRQLTVESFWTGGSAQWTVEAEIQGENASVSIRGADSRNIRIEDGVLTIWTEEGGDRFTAALDSEAATLRLQDAFQMLYTYEDILALDEADIRSADYNSYDGRPYIHVETVSAAFQYRCVWYISVESGLLERMEIYDGEQLIYRLVADEAELIVPELTSETP